MIYEWLAARLRALRRPAARIRGERPHVGPAAVFLMSAAAKVGATLATYPMLVVKSRLQAATRGTDARLRYAGVLDALRRIAAEEGAAGFYRGMRVKLTQTVVAAALMMTLKEEIYGRTHAALHAAAAVAGAGGGGGGGGAGGAKRAAVPAARGGRPGR